MASWLDGNNLRAKTPARCGVARCGATRIGWTPKDVILDASDNPLYPWTQQDGPQELDPSTTWTQATGVGGDPR